MQLQTHSGNQNLEQCAMSLELAEIEQARCHKGKSTHNLRAQKWVPRRIISRNTAPPVPFLA
eukprot:COSAG04_NODE_20729_length_387_cov_1.840278_1_plen_61_part_01